jgi:hypothetical protein
MNALLRVIAGVLALSLFCAYVVANLWGVMYCILITPFRQRSLLYTVAETNLIFAMLDWRKAIIRLAEVALDR